MLLAEERKAIANTKCCYRHEDQYADDFDILLGRHLSPSSPMSVPLSTNPHDGGTEMIFGPRSMPPEKKRKERRLQGVERCRGNKHVEVYESGCSGVRWKQTCLVPRIDLGWEEEGVI